MGKNRIAPRFLLFEMGVLWEYYIKNQVDFAIKCQKVLAICAKPIYNDSAICVIRICAMF